MFSIVKLAALSLLAVQTLASPAGDAAGVCNTNNACYSAIKAHTPIESCRYLERKTVLPCPVTKTITATETAKPIISLQTIGTTRTTFTVTITALLPTLGAQQEAAPQQDVEQQEDVAAPVVTEAAALPVKREEDVVTSTRRCTKARTFGVSVVPASLKACSNIGAVSAACACFNVPEITITDPARTTIHTSTTTVGGATITETVKATLTITKSITIAIPPISLPHATDST